MTADNRTNEPKQKQNQILPNFAYTDDQVEAAAKAVREVDARAGLIADVDLPMYRARAALVAAARVAPVVQQVSESDLAENLEHWIFQYNQERITLKTFARAVVEAIGGESR